MELAFIEVREKLMKAIIAVGLMIFGMNSYAGASKTIELGEIQKHTMFMDIDHNSPEKIIVKFTMKYKTRKCINRQFGVSDNRIVHYGCPIYTYTNHLNPEDLVIKLDDSSAISKLQNQKIKIEIFPTQKYGDDYDASVTIVSGSDDEVIKGKTFMLNNKFVLKARKNSVAVIETDQDWKIEESSLKVKSITGKEVISN